MALEDKLYERLPHTVGLQSRCSVSLRSHRYRNAHWRADCMSGSRDDGLIILILHVLGAILAISNLTDCHCTLCKVRLRQSHWRPS